MLPSCAPLPITPKRLVSPGRCQKRTTPTHPHRTAPHRTAPHRIAPHRKAPHHTAPHGTARHRTAPHGTAPLRAPHIPKVSLCSAIVLCSALDDRIAHHTITVASPFQLLLEPKPREPMAHQYNFDSETTLGFLDHHGLIDQYALNLEANHGTLAVYAYHMAIFPSSPRHPAHRFRATPLGRPSPHRYRGPPPTPSRDKLRPAHAVQ